MNDEEKDFITERVLDEDVSRRKTRRTLLKCAGIILGAVCFGVIASLTFVLTKPIFEMKIEGEPDETVPIVIPQDEPETKKEGTSEEAEETEAPEENIEEIVDQAVNSREWSAEDYKALYDAYLKVATDAGKGIVTVSVSTSETDLFENEIRKVGSQSGAIWSIGDKELFILTGVQKGMSGADLSVSFCNGTTVKAELCGMDTTTGIAVLSVGLSSLDAITKASIGEIPLGNSLMTQAGQQVCFVGSPRNYVGSVDTGIISYVYNNESILDMEYRCLGSSLAGDEQTNGFILDMNGSMIGMILKGMGGNSTEAIGISDLKGILEKLANRNAIACLGFTGIDVTDAISRKNNDIPIGIYVSGLDMEGAAFDSGLQAGDIIIKLDGTEILSMKTLESYILSKTPGDQIRVTAMRVDRDTYTEMTFTVELGKR